MSGTVKVWWCASWYWALPSLGFDIGAKVTGGDCPRWFKLELKLLFLWLALHIDGVGDEEEDPEQ